MQLALTTEQATVMARDMLLEDSLMRLVESYRGLKDTELAMLVIAEQDETISFDQVFGAIRQMLREGRLVGIEYCWQGTPGTFVLPATAKAVIPIPVRITQKHSFH